MIVIKMLEYKTLEELVTLVEPEIIQRIETFTDASIDVGIGLCASVTFLSVYVALGKRVPELKRILASLLVGTFGAIPGASLGYHAGREYSAHKISQEYPAKAKYILEWEKKTHIPM